MFLPSSFHERFTDFQKDSTFISVTQLNKSIQKLFSDQFGFVKIIGEIASLQFHSSGHIYLSLKDTEASINAVIFKNVVKNHYKEFQQGDLLLIWGSLSLYYKKGQYSLQIYHAIKQNKGSLYYQFLEMKEHLEQEGLFQEDHKKILPEWIRHLVIITSLDGAALGDIQAVMKKNHFPFNKITVIPTLMQGDQAEKDIINSLSIIQEWKKVDAVLITRGGGSDEDLDPFNQENLAYAVYHHPQLIISAIGHERDFTILDFVADIRYSTPTQAAHHLCRHQLDFQQKFISIQENLALLIFQKLKNQQLEMKQYKPTAFFSLISHQHESQKQQLKKTQKMIQDFHYLQINRYKLRLNHLQFSFNSYNPMNIFEKGFVFIRKKNQQQSIQSIQQLKENDTLLLQLKDGQCETKIIKIDSHEQ